MRASHFTSLGIGLLLATATAQAQDAPNLSGMWRLDGSFSAELKTVEGQTPPLLPSAAKVYRERKAIYRPGANPFDNASTICVSAGMPRMMFLPYPFQIIQSRKQMAFFFEWNGRHRLVDLSGAAIEPPDLFYMGTAGGHVDGNALVVVTEGLNDSSLLDASGMPHSDQLRLTERYTLGDGGNTLVDEMTIEDPKTFAKPWRTRVTYRRMPAGSEIQEDVCRERMLNGGSAFELEKPR